MGIWDELTGQADAVAIFSAAAGTRQESASASSAVSADVPATAGDPSSMTHAWLVTGPPGSGRSNIAYAFATALLATGPDDVAAERQVRARTHPDLGVLSTERVIITMLEVKQIVKTSQFSPSVGRYRVMVIEDADRMTERTSNVLLKALEEPPPRTVWILCAPSEADLIPTIRSRVRTVRLKVPAVDEVAALIARREGVDIATATRAARESQSHIGMARRLATDEGARTRRARTLQIALGIGSVSDGVRAAATLLELAGEDAKAITAERDAEERASALHSLGVAPGGTIPPALRAQLKALEEDQKRRATRSLRDGIDRIMVDLLSLYRDVLLLQLGAGVELINLSIHADLIRASEQSSAAGTLAIMDAIATARRRIESNVAPALALEAMLVAAARSRTMREVSR